MYGVARDRLAPRWLVSTGRRSTGMLDRASVSLRDEVAGHVDQQRRSVEDQQRALELARASLTGSAAAGARSEEVSHLSEGSPVRVRGG